ncbi:MAG TPA: alpha/beta hydrolase [Candidatus Acidoferrales bacterium]|nr:alpha/beta hydrolase [Candidatus Acidoferrales bacterium]
MCTLTAALGILTTLCAPGCANKAEAPAQTRGPREEAVHFANGEVTLAGTLVLPAGASPGRKVPAVVLYHGSGPQERDLFTARWFAGEGIAALAYDKRGVGESTGNFKKVPFLELCGDGLAGIEYLKMRAEVDVRRIGVWGLSQGGWLGPLAASRSGEVAWVIAVSGPGVSPGEQMIFYYAEELRAEGMKEKDVEEVSALRRQVWTYAETGIGYASARTAMEAARAKPWYHAAKAQADDLFGPLLTPEEQAKPGAMGYRWFRQEAIYDPVPALRALHVPALFLFGEEDRLVPVEVSVKVIRKVEEEEKKDFTIRVFPGADHAMYLRAGGLSPEYLKAMAEWLKARVLNAAE